MIAAIAQPQLDVGRFFGDPVQPSSSQGFTDLP
jgi:hypothetical protein